MKLGTRINLLKENSYIINISAICSTVPWWQLTKILNQAHLILWHIWSDTYLKKHLKGTLSALYKCLYFTYF